MLNWIWLSKLEGTGPISQRLLLQHFHTPENIYSATYEDLVLQRNRLRKSPSDIFIKIIENS